MNPIHCLNPPDRNNFFEQTADVAAASYGPDLAKGGIEFYDKMLARNVALRELLGKESEKRFTPQGELRNCFSNWIRNFNLPVYHRTIMVVARITFPTLYFFPPLTCPLSVEKKTCLHFTKNLRISVSQ